MMFLNLLVDLDKLLAKEDDIQKKNKIKLAMLMIECKYNLDILSSLNLDNIINNNQLRLVINLLSTTALEIILIEGFLSVDSKTLKFFYTLTASIKKITSFEDQEQIKEDDPLLLNLYKRISVLKAISTIDPPYTALKEINFKSRLLNLKEVLLQLNAKTIINIDGTIKE